jgi:CMP-N-acetylneuraminic acid synthetase
MFSDKETALCAQNAELFEQIIIDLDDDNVLPSSA